MKRKSLAIALGLMMAVGCHTDVLAAKVMDENGRLQEIRVMDLENHFVTPDLFSTFEKVTGMSTKSLGCPESMLQSYREEQDLDELRLKKLDEAGIDYAQISLTAPGAEFFEVEIGKKIATEANNRLAEAIKKHPDRIGGYMTLVPSDVEWSLKEIDRCLEMGLWGWCTMSNYGARDRLDNPAYLPLLERCNELKMPIFIHPFFPVDKQITEAGYCLYGPNYGFTVDTQLTFLRLMFRGVFDKCPDLKIILGHNAEGLAIYIDRLDTAYRQEMGDPAPSFGTIKQKPSYYLRHNLYGDTSGNFNYDVFQFTRYIFGDKAMVLGTDYPYEDAKASVDLILKSDKLTFKEKKAILQDSAESLGFGGKRLKR